ncbi:AAA family ATPase [Sorangium sp. So ce281]|uniref:AAA family ATPase n=1 Tax=unclassified Sorangium TaxID=2621164 RepID=UPI003F62378C
MRFRVEHLGPLREAEVDLSKDLIVLTGPNNSGKTYLAWAVYGLLRFHPSEPTESIEALSEALLAAEDQSLPLADVIPYLRDHLASLAKAFTPAIHQCFAAESDRFRDTIVSLRFDSPRAVDEWVARLASSEVLGGTTERWFLVVAGAPSSSKLEFRLHFRRQRVGPPEAVVLDTATVISSERALVRRFLNFGLATLIADALGQCILFPAERIAVNIFAKELALKRTELVDELLDASARRALAEPNELIERRAGRYPWPIRDSLRVANDLASISTVTSGFEDLANDIEAAVLGGEVSVSDLGEMVFSPGQAPERRLSVHLTASVVKSLASLVFYFRHMAREGDFLIIDEPELNLHPDNQRKIARILAKAVNRGFRIMMSTHSDYLIRELNHLLMLGRLTAGGSNLVDELEYDRASLLRPEQVGVYLFNDHRAQAVSVTESGFEVKTIDDEINRLNAVSQRIYAELDRLE